MSNAVVRSRPFIRHTTIEDIRELSLSMREEDKLEIILSSGTPPYTVLLRGYTDSNSVATIEWDGRVMALFGVTGIKGEWGCPWMLGAGDLKRCKSLLRECRKVLSGYLDDYTYLTNACWSGNLVHIKWIEWLGFTFSGSDTRNGELFLHFHKGSHV